MNCILAVPPGREKVKLLLCFTSTLWGNQDMQRIFFAGDDCAYQKLQSCVYELLDVGEYEDLKMIQENIDDLFQCCVCWGRATALIVILCEERIRIQNERYSCIQSF